MKVRKYYVIFVYIVQGKIGKVERKDRKSDQNTVNDRNYVFHFRPNTEIETECTNIVKIGEILL